MNLSRAYGLALDAPLSVGRVQTPTLAMLVERELAIRDFVPEDYLEVLATFSAQAGRAIPGHLVRSRRPRSTRSGLPPSGEAARAIVERALDRAGAHRERQLADQAAAAAAAVRPDRAAAARQPALRLLGAAHARRGAGAVRKAQAHQLPAHRQPAPVERGRAARCPSDRAAPFRRRTRRCWPRARARARCRERFVDDSKVTDHHAIIPTTRAAPRGER